MFSLLKQPSTTYQHLFSKAALLDILHHSAYGLTATTGAAYGTSDKRRGLFLSPGNTSLRRNYVGASLPINPWNQAIGRFRATSLWNDVDPYRNLAGWQPSDFTYSIALNVWWSLSETQSAPVPPTTTTTWSYLPIFRDPEHIDNFIFNYELTKMMSEENYTNVNTILHNWMRAETGYLEPNKRTIYGTTQAYYQFTQSTTLFVNPQVGGVTPSGADFATVSRSIGVFTRQEVSYGYIDYAYDFMSSRVGNGTTQSKIGSHVAFFAQSKADVSKSTGLSLSAIASSVFDPTGRTNYDFKVSPTQWPATYSYNQEPWSFYAESDKANLGGGLLIDRGATFGTSLNAWLEIQGHTASKSQIRLRPQSGTPSNLGQGDIWYNGTNLYFYDGSNYFDLVTSQNTGEKARLGIYPSAGTRLDDQISWNDTGSVSVVLESITDRDWQNEEIQAIGYISYTSSFGPLSANGGTTFSVFVDYPTRTLIGTFSANSSNLIGPGLYDFIDRVNANPLGYKAAMVSAVGGFTVSLTPPFSTLAGTKYGALINGFTPSVAQGNTNSQFGQFVGFSTPFLGGVSVPPISYTIPSNNKSQQFVMTEGGQEINGFKKFVDDQIFFGPTISTTTSTFSTRWSYGTVSQAGYIAHNIVGATALWTNYARYTNANATVSHSYVSSTGSQFFNVKQQITWKDSLANTIWYDKGVPKLSTQRTNNTVANKKHDRFLIDSRVWGDGTFYKGSPILNISEWTSFISSPNISLDDNDLLTSLKRGLTNSNPNETLGGFLIGKGTSIQHHQWNDIGHLADIINFQYTENGGWPADHYFDNYFNLDNSDSLGQGRVRSKNTVHHYLKAVVNMDPPVIKGYTISRYNQDRHTSMFIETVGSGNPDYSFGVYHKSFGPHGKISADFYAAKPSNVFYNDTYEANNSLTSSQVSFYAQSKVELPGRNTDPLGRNLFYTGTDDPWAEKDNTGKFGGNAPWSFFA